MDPSAYWKIIEKTREPEAVEKTVAYLAEHLGRFLKKGERVLICFRYREVGSLSWFFEQAVRRCEAEPVVWSDDLWKTLLREAFVNRVTAIIGPPLILLGLMKLKKQYNTPLPIRRVVAVGYPCLDWVIDGIVNGLDCELGGCFSLHETGVVAGFACGHSWGVHLREDFFDAGIVDEQGNPLPAGELGEVVLIPKRQPQLRVPLGDLGRIAPEKCACGSESNVMGDSWFAVIHDDGFFCAVFKDILRRDGNFDLFAPFFHKALHEKSSGAKNSTEKAAFFHFRSKARYSDDPAPGKKDVPIGNAAASAIGKIPCGIFDAGKAVLVFDKAVGRKTVFDGSLKGFHDPAVMF